MYDPMIVRSLVIPGNRAVRLKEYLKIGVLSAPFEIGILAAYMRSSRRLARLSASRAAHGREVL
jgi:hypothetical protein